MLKASVLTYIVVLILLSPHERAREFHEYDIQTDSSVWNLKLNDFINKVTRKHPQITGGCVTLTSAALANSVIIMALEVSVTKERNAQIIKSVDSLNSLLKIKKDSLQGLADLDLIIFKKFLDIYKLPAITPQQKKIRDSLSNNALIEATRSPLTAGMVLINTLRITKESVKYCSNSTVSDIGSGSLLIKGSLDGILLIARSNISFLHSRQKEKLKTILEYEASLGNIEYSKLALEISQRVEHLDSN